MTGGRNQPSPELLKGIHGFIFDCDGVLVESKDANRMYYNTVRETIGMLPMTPEEEDYVHAHAVIPSMQRIIPPEKMAEAEAVRRRIKFTDMLPYTTLQPGLVELLATLREFGFKLSVNTNRTDSMEMLLETFELTEFFDPVITAAKVKHPKPNPEGVHAILRHWGVTRQQVAYIGDTGVDEQTARAAGVSFWAFRNPGLKAALHVEDYEPLRRWVVACLG
ncbi:MAG: HAD family hydrolase [Acidobacteriota bacterium]